MIVVFTTIFGRSDSLKPAPVGADRCVCFVDRPEDYPAPQGWEIHGYQVTDPRRDAWRVRCQPHDLFPEANQTVWIDASFTLTDLKALLRDAGTAPIAAIRHHRRSSCYAEGRELVAVKQSLAANVDRQLQTYRQAGFSPTHLSIACVIVRQHTPAVAKFNQTWDREISTHPGDNTQLSLDYSAWVNGLDIKALRGTRHDNPYARHDARDHRQRRQPYRPEHTHVR